MPSTYTRTENNSSVSGQQDNGHIHNQLVANKNEEQIEQKKRKLATSKQLLLATVFFMLLKSR